MARFGDEDDESTDLFDDELAELEGRSGSGSAAQAGQAGQAMIAKVVIGAVVVAACAGVLLVMR